MDKLDSAGAWLLLRTKRTLEDGGAKVRSFIIPENYGPLFGTLFLRMGTSLGDTETVTPDQVAAALRAGLDGVEARGKAYTGDKTMYDALAPAVDALEKALAEGTDLPVALGKARDAAMEGRDATIPMLARKGRASYLGERSVGHQDPGATSVALLLDAVADTVA